jgi:hypothetical protein
MQGGTKSAVRQEGLALRQEGQVRFGRLDEFYKNMALLAEGGRVSSQVL